MKIFTIFFFILAGLAAHAQTYFIDTVKQGRSDRVGTKTSQPKLSQTIYHPDWPVDEDRKNKAPAKFRVDTITATQFETYASSYNTGIDTSSSEVLWTDSSFIIKNVKSQQAFNTRYGDNYSVTNYYEGFITSLNLYSVFVASPVVESAWRLLIDKKTGKQYYFGSPSDFCVEAVFISPGKNYLLGYENNAYVAMAVISILKINKTGNTYTLQDYYGINIWKAEIKQLVWIDDNSFALAMDDLMSRDGNSYTTHYIKFTANK